jgi:sporulation protein YlmC with PRC-barrel domain
MRQHPDTPPDSAAERLAPLRSLPGYRLSEEEPDIRGWRVIGADGGRIGTVDELLVDRGSAEVAALAVTAGRELVVVPMERTRIDDDRRLVVAKLTREQFAALPRAGAAPPAATTHPGVTVERSAEGEEVIRVPIVREELVVERRPVVKEVIVIRKRAAREERVIEADLRRERLEVDRRDLDPGRG